MNESFQKLFDYYKKPVKYGENTEKIRDIIFKTIGKKIFCSIMDMEYKELSSYYMGRYSVENARFYNDQWELNFSVGKDDDFRLSNITLKKEGTYSLYNPRGENHRILESWLEYFKRQCKMNGIEIND